MLARDDMVYLMWRIGLVFMKEANSHRYAARSATNRRCDSLTSFAKLRVLTCPRFRHDHDVLELQVVLKFRLLFRRDATVLGPLDQLRQRVAGHYRKDGTRPRLPVLYLPR
jgi:hypothetical protein